MLSEDVDTGDNGSSTDMCETRLAETSIVSFAADFSLGSMLSPHEIHMPGDGRTRLFADGREQTKMTPRKDQMSRELTIDGVKSGCSEVAPRIRFQAIETDRDAVRQ